MTNNGVDDTHERIETNEIRRPRETGSRSDAMENHDSPSSEEDRS